MEKRMPPPQQTWWGREVTRTLDEECPLGEEEGGGGRGRDGCHDTSVARHMLQTCPLAQFLHAECHGIFRQRCAASPPQCHERAPKLSVREHHVALLAGRVRHTETLSRRARDTSFSPAYRTTACACFTFGPHCNLQGKE